MKNHIQNKEKADEDFYQKYLKGLYSKINEKRNFDNIFGYLVRTSGYLIKQLNHIHKLLMILYYQFLGSFLCQTI